MSADDDLAVARAYLSRVAEPASLVVWELVERLGPQAAAEVIRSGAGSAEVIAATTARRGTDPRDDLDSAARHGIRLVVPEDEEWPHFALSAMDSLARERWRLWTAGDRTARSGGELVPPLALWVKGPGSVERLGIRSVAIIGARASSGYGTHVAADLGYGLATHGVGVVSGGAFGIDAAAHRGALGASGSTVLISAGGLDRPYPSAHASLFEQVGQTGLLVSESPPGSAPYRRRFLSRNRLIACLSGGTVVVEAGRRSGSLNTAAHARRLGRALMVVPGPITSATSVGCHDLLRGVRVGDTAEVRLITGVDDVLAEIGSPGEGLHSGQEPGSGAGPAQKGPPGVADITGLVDGLDAIASAVHDALRPARWSSDDALSVASGQPVPAVRQALAALLLYQLAESGPEGHRLHPRVARLRRAPR